MERESVMEYVLSALFTSTSAVTFIMIYDSFFERKYQAKKFFSLVLMLVTLIYLFLNIGNEYSSLNVFSQTAEPLFFFFMCFFLYKGNFLPKLFVAISAYCIILALSTVFKIFSAGIFHLSTNAFMENRLLYTLFLFAANFCILFLASLFRYAFSMFKHADRGFKSTPFLFVICLFPISTIYTILFFVKEILKPNVFRYSFYDLIPLIAFLGATNLAALVMVSWFQTHTEEHKKLVSLSEQTRAQQECIEALSVSYENQRKMSHDFHKHMQVLSNLLLSDDMENAKQYLNQISEWQTSRVLIVETNNSTMNALLNQKAYAAKAHRIDMIFKVNDLSGLAIKTIDYILVLGNLLDNALEACQTLPKESFKQISVKVVLEENTLFISIRNPSNPVKIKENSIATTKQNPALHGFGLPTIKEILRNNNAEYVMRYKDGFFTFAIEWQNKAASSLH